MTRYIVRRILLTIPVLIGVVTLVFVMGHLLPGSQCAAILGEHTSPEACAAYDHAHGFDRPIPVQFVDFLAALLRGDLGTSIKASLPVTDMLISRLPTTIELAFFALLIAIPVGVLLGIISARKRNSSIDVGTMAVANLGVSIPIFVLGPIMIFIFAILLKGTSARPAAGRPAHPGSRADAAGDCLGPPGPHRTAARCRGLRLEHLHAERDPDAAAGTSSSTPCGT